MKLKQQLIVITEGRELWSSGYGRRLVFQKVVSSNPGTIYWMDIFFTFIYCKNCNVCLKDKNKLQSGWGWPI